MDETHYKNFLYDMHSDILRQIDNVIQEHQAFVRVAADWLGFEDLDEEINFIDGAGDRGVDFWCSSDSVFEIFQVKSHELSPTRELSLGNFDVEGVNDLHRILQFLTTPCRDINIPAKLKRFNNDWEHLITTRKMAETPDDPLQVTLGLVIFGDGLTTPASSEFKSFQENISSPITYRDVIIHFHPRLYTIRDLIDARWRELNQNWRDKDGKKKDTIELHPQDLLANFSWLQGRHNAAFYCRAIDLISAFAELGYQIFEPNVRAHIPKSKVNAAIRKSLASNISRREFHFLNNGITMTCMSFSKPNENRPFFRVIQPGVVNGLQTVVALHDAYYNDLDSDDKKHLDENCFVLVRLLTLEAVQDINKVVLASNTQNPMQARNLRSNSTEQIYYERLFAKELGWFYQRKQGSWEAFKRDPSRWRTLPNCKPSLFKVGETPGRPRYKIVDNEDIAQTWLAFIGFSFEAVHEKQYLFEQDKYYDTIFLHRTVVHGADRNYQLSQINEDWLPDAPSPSMLLVSYLARQFAKEISLPSKQNRERAVQRLYSEAQKLSKEQIDALLIDDDDYLLEQVISAMTFVFTEFFGYILYRAVGGRIHDLGDLLLHKGSLLILSDNAISLNLDTIRDQQVDPEDLLALSWWIFRHCLNQLMAGPWKQAYQSARSRTQFNHSVNTRQRLYEQLNNLDRFMMKVQLTEPWATGIEAKKGLFHHFQSILKVS